MTTPTHHLSSAQLLADALKSAPFPWQQRLLESMLSGDVPGTLDLPTGLGKTSVMAIWLVARMLGAAVPRRLVYVVDRRAVVDQATEEAKRLRKWVENNSEYSKKLGLEKGKLPISTLRGQFVDNREWLEDPANPAIIVGTVDMIGSRLLFEGYGASRKIRPYHAALLACDAFFVIDEAHLIPPFQALLTSIPPNPALHAQNNSLPDNPPPLRVMSLSATQRTREQAPFSLSDLDKEDSVVKQRLDAPKHLRILPAAPGARVVEEMTLAAWSIYQEKNTPLTCIVFCNGRDDADKVAKGLREKAKKEKIEADVELFVGERRVREREASAKRLKDLGFLAGEAAEQSNANKPRFLVATSAAEVGVDLDANHLVGDVVPWERMVQRLGRVNRRGEGSALVRIVATPSDSVKKALDKGKDDESGQAARYHATLALLQKLPSVGDNEFNASPAALRNLDRDEETLIAAAMTPAPLHPALDRATLDAWAMTSLPEHPGRPFVAPWLRGWVDDEAQVTLVWRRYIESGQRPKWSDDEKKSFVEAVPMQTSEALEVGVDRAKAWLKQRVKTLVTKKKENEDDVTLDSTVALVLNAAGEFTAALTLKELITDEKLGESVSLDRRAVRANESKLERDYLPNGTLLLDARIGGLSLDGLLNDEMGEVPVSADDAQASWLDDEDTESPVIRFKISEEDNEASKEKGPDAWPARLRLPWEIEGEEIKKWLVVRKWRHDAATEEDRSAGHPQLLTDHQAWTEERAALLGTRLKLSDRGVALLKIAARLHDEGKRAKIWQRAMKAPAGNDIWAKTKGPVAPKLLNGYRHEFGSLGYVAKDAEFQTLSEEERDLVLHMVAAHHGYARPLIGTNGVEDRPPSAAKELAQEVALRYFRLSERWGPWGLAYWESLLRAADQQASRKNDEKGGL